MLYAQGSVARSRPVTSLKTRRGLLQRFTIHLGVLGRCVHNLHVGVLQVVQGSDASVPVPVEVLAQRGNGLEGLFPIGVFVLRGVQRLLTCRDVAVTVDRGPFRVVLVAALIARPCGTTLLGTSSTLLGGFPMYPLLD